MKPLEKDETLGKRCSPWKKMKLLEEKEPLEDKEGRPSEEVETSEGEEILRIRRNPWNKMNPLEEDETL
jgi:hypothetical protein